MTNNLQTAQSGISAPIGKWLSEGWELFKKDPTNQILGALVVWVLYIAAGSSTFYLGSLVIGGPLFTGYFLMLMNLDRGQAYGIGNIFDGFKIFLPSFLAFLIMKIFIAIGFSFCILPGFVVAGLYIFVLPYLADYMDAKADFWEVMEKSRKMVWLDFVSYSIFAFVLFVIMLAGLLTCGIGVIVAWPIVSCAMVAAYKDVFGYKGNK